jgi:hypothetical protein
MSAPLGSRETSDRELAADERRWLARLQRTLDAQPKSLTIYCHGDSATALDSQHLEAVPDDTRGAILSDARVINTRGWIAGDF